MTGIYMLRNRCNGKLYIGSTTQGFAARWKDHAWRLRLGVNGCSILQAAWNKYGKDAFEFRVIEECAPKACLSREQWWIDGLKPEYNACPIAGSQLGAKRSPEACERIADGQRRYRASLRIFDAEVERCRQSRLTTTCASNAQ